MCFRTSESDARVSGTLQALPAHPNIIDQYGTYCDKGALCLVFRYHDASLFHMWRAARGRLELDQAARYSRHVCSGLAHLHRHGICHRDVCLSNLLVSFRDNVVQVCDLGLAACAASFTLERNVTQMQARAPEVLLAQGPGVRTSVGLSAPLSSVDLWSAGTVLAALHFGAELFGKATTYIEQLQAMVDFLGPPLPAWPEAAKLKFWKMFAEKAVMEVPAQEPGDFLASSVSRPLPKGHPAIDLTLSLLRWNPSARADMEDALRHAYFDDEEPGLPLSPSSPQTPCKLPAQHRPRRLDFAVAADCCACAGSCGNNECGRRKSRGFRQRQQNGGGMDPICDKARAKNTCPPLACAALTGETESCAEKTNAKLSRLAAPTGSIARAALAG